MKKIVYIPQSWDEITEDQYIYFVKLVYPTLRSSIGTRDLLIRFAKYLVAPHLFSILTGSQNYLLLLNRVANHLEWIFEDDNNHAILLPKTTRQLIPTISGYQGIKSHAQDLTFAQYMYACNWYNQFTINNDLQSLNALTACLYLPKGALFKKDDLPKRAKRMESVAPSIKWGVYLWFGNLLNYLMHGDFIISGKTICFSKLFSSSNSDNTLGMSSILFTLAETKTFGGIAQVEQALVLDVFMKLLNDQNQAESLKKQYK